MTVFEKQVNVQCGIGSISMLISSHIQNAANCAIIRTDDKANSENLKFSFLENNRVQQGLIEKSILAFSTTFT